jgi:hypothetical protein
MSYVLDFVVPRVPNRKGQAWDFLEDLQDRYEEDRKPAHPLLLKLHQILVTRYPCLSSYADGDPDKADCVWADGPLINNFASEMGMVAIAPAHVPEVLAFAVESALALGITVMDGQDEKIYRPK